MKLLAAIAFALTLSSAHALHTVHCGNAEGTVRWEAGDDTANKLTMKKRNGGQLVLDMDNVVLVPMKVVDISVQEINECGLYLRTHAYAGDFKIIPSSTSPRDMTSVSENNEINTTVICRDVIRSLVICE